MNFVEGLSAGLLRSLRQGEATLWCNPDYGRLPAATLSPDLGSPEQAAQRMQRHAQVLAQVFPELSSYKGLVRSPLVPVPGLHAALLPEPARTGDWFLKEDHNLPVAGSVKARGGFHEVLCLAEDLLQKKFGGQSTTCPDLASAPANALFSRYTVAVGSTGNLGLSIGLIARALGFKAVVHMSADAKQWKKDRLRSHDIEVIEHTGDYARAVQSGREQAEQDPYCYFVDDEHSVALFMGYAASATELAEQLAQAGRKVNATHPLFVYLPCGVGGAPGGILYGLKQRFGQHVHGFFAEPVASPCMLVQVASGGNKPVSVYDIGLNNRTEADGLAVGLASPFVAPMMPSLLAGVFTVPDDRLFCDIVLLNETHGTLIEPYAAAGFSGPQWLLDSPVGKQFLAQNSLSGVMANATHVLWSTGGSLVPAVEHESFQARGRALLNASA